MTREELEHAIRAACDVVKETEVYVFGSQSILGQYPDAPEALRTTWQRASSWHFATRIESL